MATSAPARGDAGSGWISWCYFLAALASVALSAWSAYAQHVPNPDSVLYMRAAEYFAAGEWSEGFEIYRWPLYSLLIGGVMALSGLDAFVAAQVVNAILTVGTVCGVISLADRLTNGDRALVGIATLIVIFQPQLIDLRAYVVRDHGYWCFSIFAICLAVSDNQSPALRRKLTIAAAILLATLFRIEGMYLGLLIVCYYLLARLKTAKAQAVAISIFVMATAIVLPLAFGVWVSGTIGKWASGDFSVSLELFANAITRRLDVLERGLNLGGGQAWPGYIGLVVGITLVGLVRALTPVFAFYGFFAFLPHRLIHERAVLPVVWFSLGQVPMFMLFTFINAFFAWRYAITFALIAMFTTIFCIAASWRELTVFRPRSFIVFPSFIVAAGIAWALDAPKSSSLAHYKEAGFWIRDHVPEGANIWLNEPRIAYYTGRPYRELAGVSAALRVQEPEFVERDDIQVYVVANDARDQLPVPKATLHSVARFDAPEDRGVEVFATCADVTECVADEASR